MSPLCLFEDSLLDLPQRASRASPASLAIPSLLPVTDTEHGAPSWSAVARQGLSMVLDTISLAEVRDTPLLREGCSLKAQDTETGRVEISNDVEAWVSFVTGQCF